MLVKVIPWDLTSRASIESLGQLYMVQFLDGKARLSVNVIVWSIAGGLMDYYHISCLSKQEAVCMHNYSLWNVKVTFCYITAQSGAWDWQPVVYALNKGRGCVRYRNLVHQIFIRNTSYYTKNNTICFLLCSACSMYLLTDYMHHFWVEVSLLIAKASLQTSGLWLDTWCRLV